jgi:hypothetical protein
MFPLAEAGWHRVFTLQEDFFLSELFYSPGILVLSIPYRPGFRNTTDLSMKVA